MNGTYLYDLLFQIFHIAQIIQQMLSIYII